MLMNLAVSAMFAMAAPPGGGAGGGQGNWWSSLLPLVVIFGIFYFLMIRPQQKQQKKVREMLAGIKKGDSVVTRGGIMGQVYGIAENIVTLEVAENIRIKCTRDSISGVQPAK